MSPGFGFLPSTIRSSPCCRDTPFSFPVTPSASHSRAGPEQSGSLPRRLCIVARPAIGSSARIRTAAG